MARPRNEVRLSFEEDTVRFRIASSYWCEDWRRVTRQPDYQRRLEEVWPSWSVSYLGNPLPDSVVVDWRDSCREIEGACRSLGESYHYRIERESYWATSYMGPTRHYDEEEGQRARNLLVECLSPSQREEFVHTKSFTVISKSNRTYRIEFGRNYNVKLLDDNQRSILAYCAGLLEDVPIADMMLVQKLMLENDEERFLRIANTQGDPFEELRFVVSHLGRRDER